jgi:flagellar basal-body rod modification protein FlgD
MVTSSVVNGIIQDNDTSSNISSTKGTSSGSNAELDVNDFLQLLVTQMQYQDPLEPTDNTEYIAQMATFTQVSATTSMNTNVMKEMASNLVGKTVIVKSDIDSTEYVAGQVQSWEKANDGIYLRINDKLYDIEDLDRVLDESYYEELLKNNSVG